jgi:hypothetical protein
VQRHGGEGLYGLNQDPSLCLHWCAVL